MTSEDATKDDAGKGATGEDAEVSLVVIPAFKIQNTSFFSRIHYTKSNISISVMQ